MHVCLYLLNSLGDLSLDLLVLLLEVLDSAQQSPVLVSQLHFIEIEQLHSLEPTNALLEHLQFFLDVFVVRVAPQLHLVGLRLLE